MYTRACIVTSLLRNINNNVIDCYFGRTMKIIPVNNAPLWLSVGLFPLESSLCFTLVLGKLDYHTITYIYILLVARLSDWIRHNSCHNADCERTSSKHSANWMYQVNAGKNFDQWIEIPSNFERDKRSIPMKDTTSEISADLVILELTSQPRLYQNSKIIVPPPPGWRVDWRTETVRYNTRTQQ